VFLTRAYGLWLRSVRQDAKMATALGIPVGRVYMLAVGLGARGARWRVARPSSIQYQMGFDILATVFIVVVIGLLASGAAATACFRDAEASSPCPRRPRGPALCRS
jgi:branched-subunit amino acid ABC-type transport system permease component